MKLVFPAFVLLVSLPLVAEPVKCPAAPSHIQITDGLFSSGPGIEFKLHRFSASLVPQGTALPACLTKLTVVAHADIFVSNASLTEVFSQKLEQSDSKIRDFSVSNGLHQVTLSGSITKVIPLHFSLSGPVSTNGDAIVLTVAKLKADGIPVKGLLQLIGEHLSNVLGVQGVAGITVGENSLSFQPEKLAHLKGHLTSVESTETGLVLHYGAAPRLRGARLPKKVARNTQ